MSLQSASYFDVSVYQLQRFAEKEEEKSIETAVRSQEQENVYERKQRRMLHTIYNNCY